MTLIKQILFKQDRRAASCGSKECLVSYIDANGRSTFTEHCRGHLKSEYSDDVLGKFSDVIWHLTFLVVILRVLKIFLTQYSLYKLPCRKERKQSLKNGKTASDSNHEV